MRKGLSKMVSVVAWDQAFLYELVNLVRSYLAGEAKIVDLNGWVGPRLVALFSQPEMQAAKLAGAVELAISGLEDGAMAEEEARAHLAERVAEFAWVPDRWTAVSSANDDVHWEWEIGGA